MANKQSINKSAQALAYSMTKIRANQDLAKQIRQHMSDPLFRQAMLDYIKRSLEK